MSRVSPCFDVVGRKFFFYDDFLGESLGGFWRAGGDVGGSATMLDEYNNGAVLVQTDGDATDEYYIDFGGIEIFHLDKEPTFTVRAALISVADMHSALGLFLSAANFIGFTYDASADTEWQIQSVDDGSSNEQDSGVAPDTDYHIFTFVVHSYGGLHVHFLIDGVECNNSPLLSDLPSDPTDYLQMFLHCSTEIAAAKAIIVEEVGVVQDR